MERSRIFCSTTVFQTVQSTPQYPTPSSLLVRGFNPPYLVLEDSTLVLIMRAVLRSANIAPPQRNAADTSQRTGSAKILQSQLLDQPSSEPSYRFQFGRELITSSSPDKVIIFYVGENKKAFIVHKDVACFYSPLLEAVFTSEPIEGCIQTYTVNDTTEGAFPLLVHWLY
jgi:hypothetical protein